MPVKVWDLGVRLFHWSLALLIIVNLIIGGDEAGLYGLHVWLGYAAGLLVVFRVLWGLVGSPRARFSDFIVSPRRALAYGGELLRGRVSPHAGHTPLGGYMILALLATVLAQVATGILAAQHQHWAKEVHEILVSLFWVLIALHLGGVLLHSWRARDNIVRPMITGRKDLPASAPAERPLAGAGRLAATAAITLVAGGLLAAQLDLPALAEGEGEGGERGSNLDQPSQSDEGAAAGESGEAGESGN